MSLKTGPNIVVICRVARTMPRMAPCQWLPGSCCYRQTPPMVGELSNNYQNLEHIPVACPLKSGWSSLTGHPSAGDMLYSCSPVCQVPPVTQSRIEKKIWDLYLKQWIKALHETSLSQQHTSSPKLVLGFPLSSEGNGQSSSVYPLSPISYPDLWSVEVLSQSPW